MVKKNNTSSHIENALLEMVVNAGYLMSGSSKKCTRELKHQPERVGPLKVGF